MPRNDIRMHDKDDAGPAAHGNGGADTAARYTTPTGARGGPHPRPWARERG